MFDHPYFNDIRGRIRTKLVQMQCEIESHDPMFPFEFVQREFKYKQMIPELRSKNAIIHIARSKSPDVLPYASKYKINLSNNNHTLYRQMVFDLKQTPPYSEEPYYALLTFGGSINPFSAIQFPEPGYTGVAESLPLPQFVLSNETENAQIFERKKAALKQKVLDIGIKEIVS